MSNKLKKGIKKFIAIVGCLYSFLFLLSCLATFVHPKYLYFFSFLPLLFPYIFGGMLLWLCISFFMFKKLRWLFLAITLLGLKNIFSIVAINSPKNFVQQKNKNSIRILSWNVQDFLDSQVYTDTIGNKRRDMMNFIKNANADIVCIQDFTEQVSQSYKSSIADVINAGKFPYHFFSVDFSKKYYYAYTKYGTAIFSHLPIIDSCKIEYPKNQFHESLAYVDVKKDDKILRVYNTHLQSMYIKYKQDSTIARDTSFINANDTYFIENNLQPQQRIRYFDLKHALQANIVKQQLNNCALPFVFCADLNCVPSSYTYKTIKAGLTDAFIAKGFGFGNTYDGISNTLRIDVQFLSNQLKCVQYYSPRFHASDHFPIITDVQFK